MMEDDIDELGTEEIITEAIELYQAVIPLLADQPFFPRLGDFQGQETEKWLTTRTVASAKS